MLSSLLVYLTGSAQVGAAGPIEIGNVVLTPGAATATLILHNGTGTGDPIVLKLIGTTSGASVSTNFQQPGAFPAGCYAELSGTSAVATVEVCD